MCNVKRKRGYFLMSFDKKQKVNNYRNRKLKQLKKLFEKTCDRNDFAILDAIKSKKSCYFRICIL